MAIQPPEMFGPGPAAPCRRGQIRFACSLVLLILWGCNGTGTSAREESLPATPASPPTTQPATQPAPVKPLEPPASTRADYAVLSIEPHGWLTIDDVFEDVPGAWATGNYPRQNVIEIETDNVRTLSVDLSQLALHKNKRLIVRIDGQGMQVTRKTLPIIRFVRSVGGNWRVTRK